MPQVNRNQPVRAASSESQYSLMEFMRNFPDDAACLEWLWRNRYSEDAEHAECPKCEAIRSFKRYGTAQQRQSWTCTACGIHIHPTADTIYHKSSTSLHFWFYAMYLMSSTRCGISAKQIERELGVTYKTAWRMAHLIRQELMGRSDEPLSGAVELDETWVAGKLRYKGSGPGNRGVAKGQNVLANKTAVAGAVPNVRKATLMANVEKRVLPESTVFTDELASYATLGKRG